MATDTQTGRILVETGTAGWYEDPTKPGKKTRKAEGDRVMSDEEYRRLVRDQNDVEATETPDHTQENKSRLVANEDAAEDAEDAADAAERQRQNHVNEAAKAAPVRLTSGKMATGETVTIRCAWVDPDKRTAKQQKLFEGPAREITFDKMTKAAGDDPGALPCGEERVIKKQDAFQVRFDPTHQKMHRNELRRRKSAVRKAARAAKG